MLSGSNGFQSATTLLSNFLMLTLHYKVLEPLLEPWLVVAAFPPAASICCRLLLASSSLLVRHSFYYQSKGDLGARCSLQLRHEDRMIRVILIS